MKLEDVKYVLNQFLPSVEQKSEKKRKNLMILELTKKVLQWKRYFSFCERKAGKVLVNS